MGQLGQRLKNERHRKRLTMEHMAKALGVAPSTYAGYESDYREPDLKALIKLADIFGTTLDYLIRAYSPTGDESVQEDKATYHSEAKGKHVSSGRKLREIPVVSSLPRDGFSHTLATIIGSCALDPHVVKLTSTPHVWLKVNDDSMIGSGIKTGSFVLIRLQPIVDDGEIAATCIDDQPANVRRVFFTDENIILYPENPKMRPESYSADRIHIVGTAIKLLGDL